MIEELYLRDKNKLRPIGSIEEFKEIFEKSTNQEELRVGYHDYSIEFSYDGTFFYAVDRDNEDEIIRFSWLKDTVMFFANHGKNEALKFFRKFEKSDYITDSNNTHDYKVNDMLEYFNVLLKKK